MNVYCISLRRSPERRSQMENLFENEDIVYMEAVDGLSFSPKTDKYGVSWKKTSKTKLISEGLLDQDSKLSPTQAACNLSHFAALEAFLETEEEACIVLEDDVMPTDFLVKAWREERGLKDFVSFPDGCDMLYLCDAGISWSVIFAADVDGRVSQAFTLMGYAITRRGAEVCLSVGKPMRWLLDYQFPICCYPKHKFKKENLPEKYKGKPLVDARVLIYGGPLKHSKLAEISFLGHDVNHHLHPTSKDRIRNIKRKEWRDTVEDSRRGHKVALEKVIKTRRIQKTL